MAMLWVHVALLFHSLCLLQNEQNLAEIASKHNILPQNLVNWKKAFLANAEIAMEPSKAVKEYKEITRAE
jgi:hypothetical protein